MNDSQITAGISFIGTMIALTVIDLNLALSFLLSLFLSIIFGMIGYFIMLKIFI